jgi:hypothetical protein
MLCFADARSLTVTYSPFTASIYFPTIPVISRDFHKSVELINLTVTMYMVMQGLCTPWPYCIRFVPHQSHSALFSSDVLGNAIRPLGT